MDGANRGNPRAQTTRAKGCAALVRLDHNARAIAVARRNAARDRVEEGIAFSAAGIRRYRSAARF
jgi:hypothetical protein